MLERKIILICEENVLQLTSADRMSTQTEAIPSLRSTQEETDTRVILYCAYEKEHNYKYARIKTPTTDIFICLHYVLS